MNYSKQNYYLIANLTRTYDEIHIDDRLPHIIMSCFYTDTNVDISLLAKLNCFMIVRITDSMEIDTSYYRLNKIDDNQLEQVFSIGSLLTLDGLNLFKDFLQSIFGFNNSKGKSKEEIYFRNNSVIIGRNSF